MLSGYMMGTLIVSGFIDYNYSFQQNLFLTLANSSVKYMFQVNKKR